jgi:hypothetical protein
MEAYSPKTSTALKARNDRQPWIKYIHYDQEDEGCYAYRCLNKEVTYFFANTYNLC